MSQTSVKCFVIMPFGEKTDVDGRTIDFDAIHDNVISDAITGAAMRAAGGPAIECVRCDEIDQSGWVHKQMIEAIHQSEVVVVDLSTLNPNVFYELGVRHALRNHVTVLISRKGTKTPFNLQGFKYIAYDADTPAGRAKARKAIAEYVANGLKSGLTDSLVHEVLRGPGAGAKQLQPAPAQLYKLAAIGEHRRIGVLTGDLRYITEAIDVWVNSENTNMQMARFFDKSGSAVIRYFGATRDVAGQVTQDTIADDLARQMGNHRSVPPATVIVTGAGELANSHGVKRLFHVAAVEGELGIGYAPVKDVAACVNNVLARADARDLDDVKPSSILLPLLGTGSGGADLDSAIGLLLDATVSYLQRAAKSRLTTIYFQAFTDRQLESCRRALDQRTATLA